MKRLALLLFVPFVLMGCKETKMPNAIDLADLDTTVAPGEDFYQYANGGWIKRTEIPSDRVRYGAFDILQEQTEEKVKDILFRAWERKGDTTNQDWLKIGDFYASGMDTVAIEAAGLTPLEPDLDIIKNLAEPADLVREFARERSIGGGDPFYVSVDQDSKDATAYILNISQNGLGMPDRDYYFGDDERIKGLQDAYIKMLTRFFVLMGNDEANATSMASDVFELERKMAEASLSRLEYRDPHLTYNKLTEEQLQKLTPNIDWKVFFQNLGVEMPKEVLVDNPKFLQAIDKLLKETPINVWKDYLAVHFITSYASALSQPFADASFDFYGKALSGQQVQSPRWRRVMRTTQGVLGEVIGKAYVAENFPPEAKERMLTLVQNLRAAYRERMAELPWMSAETKQKAQEKLDAITVKIGYPDKWRDYTDLSISRDSYVQNIRNGQVFQFMYTMSKLGKPVDRTEWFMYPQTVNAYYSPVMNEIVFPAAILQPPFFDMNADDAVNYGAIGVVIGHEITHGFDDQGRQYNKDGNLQNWWTSEDSLRFTEYTKLLVDQFNSFEMLPGKFVNGSLTLGENLADYGGLTISVHAFQKVLQAQGEGADKKEIDGFTPLQRFFLAYAKVWRNLTRPEEMARRLVEDVHAPGIYRVDGGVYNIDAFYQAFEVPTTSRYYRAPDERPSIW
ncbi:MAG: M13 family metallopeptidase [Bacteroides sp.]